jgi:type IV pilus assembly protein PilW
MGSINTRMNRGLFFGRRRQAGIGLVEIMISLTLGLIVTGAIVQIYLSTKRQNDMQGSLAGRQESARFAAQIIQRDAQMAGFRGCLRDVGNVTNTLNNSANFLYRFGRHVEGFEDGVGAPASIASVVANTDVLTLRTVDDPGIFTTAPMGNATADPVTVANLDPAPVAANDIALITDCGGAAIFQVTAFDAGTGTIVHNTGGAAPGNATKNLVRRYAAGSQVFTVRTTTYYIRNSANGTGPALWRRSGDVAAPQELAEGVENMQVLYGLDTDGNQTADEYRTANNITAAEWADVVSLQVALLVAGVTDRVAEADPRTFDLLGEEVGPFDDGRVRRVVTFTVALRNRLA